MEIFLLKISQFWTKPLMNPLIPSTLKWFPIDVEDTVRPFANTIENPSISWQCGYDSHFMGEETEAQRV